MAIKDIWVKRVSNYLDKDGYYKHCNVAEDMEIPIDGSIMSIGTLANKEGLQFRDILNLAQSKTTFAPINLGYKFGPSWSEHWFKVNIAFDKGCLIDGTDEVLFLWDCECESLVYDRNGEILGGLSGERKYLKLKSNLAPLGSAISFPLFIHVTANPLHGNGWPSLISPPLSNRIFTLQQCTLVKRNKTKARRALIIKTLLDIHLALPDSLPFARQALYLANKAVDMHQDAQECLKMLQSKLNLISRESKATQLVQNCYKVHAVGNCHIDTAWLWDTQQTRFKTARSWSSQLALIDQYPRFTFACSQMQQLAWLKEDYHNLFDRIVKRHAQDERFIVLGGCWVEADGNIPCGESFIRQFYYGQHFCRENFGIHSRTFWLPDTFGYNAQLPQIALQAGCEFFVSQKMSWNNINQFPLNTFWWYGLDGTKPLLAHFPPANTYTSNASVEDVWKSQANNRQLDRSNHALLLYGYGDGGGGPTETMIQQLELIDEINKGIGAASPMPQVIIDGHPEKSFFEALIKSGEACELPVWRGEMYLEFHRGTFTSQAGVKKSNRQIEHKLRLAELLWSMVEVNKNKKSIKSDCVNTAIYPHNSLDEAWKEALMLQFHDILPGSSIGKVYADAKISYEKLDQILDTLVKDAFDLLTNTKQRTQNNVSCLSYFNATCFDRLDWIERQPGSPSRDNMLVQSAPFSWAHPIQEDNVILTSIKVKHVCAQLLLIQNSHFWFTLNTMTGMVHDMGITKDILGMSYLTPDLMKTHSLLRNPVALTLYPDQPLVWDAWDIELFAMNKMNGQPRLPSSPIHSTLTSIEHQEGASFVARVTFNLSPVSIAFVTLIMDPVQPFLTFTMDIEWKESHHLLTLDLPTSIQSATYASYECPFGYVNRPCHMNTTWDQAQFEVCGHRWARLADQGSEGRAMAILTDSKYGFGARASGEMHVSLLRSPKRPDAVCDMGMHRGIKVALFPHQTKDMHQVIMHGCLFNAPLISDFGHDHLRCEQKPLTQLVPQMPLILETIKVKRDDKSGLIQKNTSLILRLYESTGARGCSMLLFNQELSVSKVTRCPNYMEDEIPQNDQDGYSTLGVCEQDGKPCWPITFSPFEIITVEVTIS